MVIFLYILQYAHTPMQITLQTSFIKLPFFKSPFCIVVQLSFLYLLVIRIVLLCLSDSVSFVAILFEVSLAVLGVALFSFLFILLYFILFSAEMSYLYSFLDSCSWLNSGSILVLSSILCMFSWHLKQ